MKKGMDTLDDDFRSVSGESIAILNGIREFPAMVISSGNPPDVAIDEILAKVGALLSASRVYILLNEKDGRYLRNTHEWVAPKTGQVMFSWPLYDYEHDVPSLKKLLSENDVFYGNTEEFPPDYGQVLQKQGVKTVITAALIRDKQVIGMLGADFCSTVCPQAKEYLNIMRMASGMVNIALERKHSLKLRQKLGAMRSIIADIEPMSFDEPREDEEIRPAKPMTLLDAERRIIVETLEMYNGNKLKTARHLGLTWPSLDRRCKKLGIEVRRR